MNEINLTRGVFVAVAALILCSAPNMARASDESEVRGTVQKVFQQLQSRDYAGIYDSLPLTTRSRMSRDRFINALKRTQDRYVLDRINIGSVRVSGNLAVADTELLGRVNQPIQAEGKIVVQQYLVREDGNWRVATGDRATIQRFLRANPSFAKRFPIRQPRIYVKQNGRWVEFNLPQLQR
ncbi:MAG: hypothetical protein ABR501_09475 [Pyrinomonadaceae bacterium]